MLVFKETNNHWDKVIEEYLNSSDNNYEHQKDYLNLINFIDNERKSYNVYPSKENVFNALKHTDFYDVSVVIIGQDPYHEKGQAHGLCFSVPKGIKVPPSLKNIFKEMKSDLDCTISQNGDLTKWADQGVLLLNTVLTVREHSANSHKGKGWEKFTDMLITKLNEREKLVIFVLWGNDAQKKELLITNPKHHILKASHPSPLSAYHGFFGCKHFSKINEILISNGNKPIDWKLE